MVKKHIYITVILIVCFKNYFTRKLHTNSRNDITSLQNDVANSREDIHTILHHLDLIQREI